MSTESERQHHTTRALSLLSAEQREQLRGLPPATPYPDRSGRSSEVILPKWIYIKERGGDYLTVQPGLSFRSGLPDLSCAFEAIRKGESSYRLLGTNGKEVGRTGITHSFPDTEIHFYWYDAPGEKQTTFLFIHARGNILYLKDNNDPSLFMSNQLVLNGCPFARNFLNEDSEMEISIAAVKNEIIDVVYDINGGKVRAAEPLIVLSTSVRNDSDGDANQALSYSYEKWSVGTWNNAAGIEVGAKTTFKAGVPFVASAEFEISIAASYTHEWGGEEGKRETINTTTTVTVPPKKKARATVVVRNAQIDVGFTYTRRVLWSNGQNEDTKLSGIYNNVDSWHVDVVLDNWEDI